MLVLTRKLQEQIHIGDNIRLTIVRVKGQTVRIGIEAPDDVRIMRSELADKPVPASKSRTAQPQEAQTGSTCRTEAPAVASHASERAPCSAESHNSPLASRVASRSAANELPRRIPGPSCSSTVRRPQRLGAASVRSLRGAMR